MTRPSDLRRLAQQLRERRDTVEATQDLSREELRALQAQERDPEYEEGAQSELADYTLSRLIENGRREIQLIEAALQRMEAGSYGECLDCGQEIALARLEALPYALRCEEDAEDRERIANAGRDATPSL